MSPDFSQIAKYCDEWIPIQAGQDTALWMAANHVILKEYYIDRQVPYFIDYVKRYTDLPFLVELEPNGNTYKTGRLLRAKRVARYKDVENGDWKMLVTRRQERRAACVKGQVGDRWGSTHGKWNLSAEDTLDNSPIDPVLSFIDRSDAVVQVGFDDFVERSHRLARRAGAAHRDRQGRGLVATGFDIMMSQFGHSRGLEGAFATSYDDEDAPYTPAWQEQHTGIGRETAIRFAREFATNAELTNGKSMVIVGASANHWYYNNLCYRSATVALILCGCCGVNGGGINHYVGQEKLAPVAPWATIALALDWTKPPRVVQSSTWHYAHSCQWRYEAEFTEYGLTAPKSALGQGPCYRPRGKVGALRLDAVHPALQPQPDRDRGRRRARRREDQ